MSAEPVEPPADPGRNPAAIRDMLPAADRENFGRFYAAALDEAKRTWSMRPVEETLEQWRRIAIFSPSPGHKQAIEDGLRIIAGKYVPSRRVDLEALSRGELPASWPTTLPSASMPSASSPACRLQPGRPSLQPSRPSP